MYCSFHFHAASFENFGFVREGLVFIFKVGRYILCDRILRTQLTTFLLPERLEFTTRQMLSKKLIAVESLILVTNRMPKVRL